MPITTLEIIDTAVKVGLGAIISALASLALNNQAAKNRKTEALNEDFRALVRDFSIKTEHIKMEIDNLAHAYFRKNTDVALSSSVEAMKSCRSANAIANIINNQNITSALSIVEQSVTAMYHELRAEVPSIEELRRHENIVFETISNLQPDISHAYQAM